MDRTYASGASGTPPSAPGSPSTGYPTAGNPATATPPTKPGPYWYYMVTEELRAVIVAAGLTPDQANVGQLSLAIAKLVQGGQRSVILNGATFAPAVTGTGKAVYWDSANSRFDLALADGSAKQNMVGFADVANGNVYAFGDAVLFSGLTAGSHYYLDGTTAGAITATAPSSNVVLVGIAKGTTEVFVDIDATVATAISVPVRQTVLAGPVDSSGLPNFGGSTGSTTVTIAGTLTGAAANGFGSSGAVDRVGQITNASWTGLSTNGTMYLYLDVAAGGTCTPGSTTLAPTYQWGGTYSTTNNQHTFNIQEMTMKVGNGSAASQVYRVFVGQVTVAGGVVSAITWYALMGRYVSADTATLPGSGVSISKNHNIGVVPQVVEFYARCTTGDGGYAVGDVMKPTVQPPSGSQSLNTTANALSGGITSANYAYPWWATRRDTGAVFQLTLASWSYFVLMQRGW